MTAPIYVYTQDWNTDTFVPSPDGPIIRHTGTYVADQPTLDAILAAAAADGVALRLDSSGPTAPGPRDAYPFIRYDRPQPSLTDDERTRAQTNLGISGVAAAVEYSAQSLTAPQQAQARGNIAAQVDLGITVVAAPTGVAATDIAALTAALATSKPMLVLQAGVYNLTGCGTVAIPNGRLLIGQGSGFNPAYSPTKLKLGASADTIEFQGGGGRSGGFAIDGQSISLKPLRRTGGTGGSMRYFEDIATWNSAQDCAELIDAQNDLWVMCTFANSVRDLVYMDKSYGGAHFLRCELNAAGRYHLRVDNAQGTGSAGYAQPTDIQFIGGIFEGSAGSALVYLNNSYKVRFHGTSFYVSNAPSGTMFDLVNAPSTTFHDCWVQCATSYQAAAVGWTVRNSSSVVLSGDTAVTYVGKPLMIDGALSYIYTVGALENYSVAAGSVTKNAQNSGTTTQITNLQTGSIIVPTPTNADILLLFQNAARTANRFQIDSNGLMKFAPVGGGTYDTWLGRQSAGVVGPPATHALCTGVGATAARPASPVAATLYLDTDLAELIYRNGANSAWVALLNDAGTKAAGYQMKASSASAYAWESGANRSTVVNAASGAAQTVTASTAKTYAILLNANCTITLANTGLVSQVEAEVEVEFVQDATGSRTVTFSPAVKWPGGTAFVASTAANAIDRVRLHTRNAGTTWYGEVLGKAYA